MPQIVPSEFPATPSDHRICFIGEAPGFEETIKGRPLVGPSGAIFDAGLRAAGIDRSQHFVGNVFSQKPEGNDVSKWMADPAIHAPELSRLFQEILAFNPNVIVPLGGTALWAFTGHTGITNYRGAVQLASRVGPLNWKLLPTYHPQAVQKQWKLLPVMVGDFIKADCEAKKGPRIVYPEVELLLDPSLADVLAWLPKVSKAPLVSVDIETGWRTITMVGLSPAPFERAMCIPFIDFRQPTRSYWQTEEEFQVWKALRAFLQGPTPKVGQNFPYDAFWLWQEKGIATMNYGEDTRLMHHALFPELQKSLAFMGARYTDLGAWKSWGGGASREKRDDN